MEREAIMALQIGDTAPDFEADTTEGRIRFHDWIGDAWCVLFSHPKDFTPVCTTELGYMAKIKPEFDKRNVKIIGLSVDPVENHAKWASDIQETQGFAPNYPMIGDTDLSISKLYGMLPASTSGTSEGRTPADNQTVRNVFVDRAGQEDQARPGLPHDHGAQLRRGAAGHRLASADRQAPGRDARELETGRGRDHRRFGVGRGGQADLSSKAGRRPSPTSASSPHPDRWRDLVPVTGGKRMLFRQLFDQTSGTYTYLFASRRGGEALIIDPVLEKVDRYLQLIRELDLKLVKAVDTHLHADHITGLGALRDRTQCITVMGEQSGVDVVSMRVSEGDKLEVEGVALDVLYTPGHTDDSYSFLLPDRVFTGDTLLIRGTGRTDFQNGNPRAQYESIFGKLLKLPDETLIFPAHDYKGDTVSTIGEEKAFNPRLQVKSVDEYADLMNNLKLPNPKMMDVAVPANMHIGLAQDEVARRGWAVTPEAARFLAR